ncbi:MAG: hypothetical protein EAX86_00800 [Candidatus Heimdallarchaeota archaeon]|nr:hypothetical protein [Candidatus Heimdallarchaeota archaeon]
MLNKIIETIEMIFQKLLRKKRAVSPILAAILLIGLAIAAGAILFVVVIPLIQNPGGTLVFDETATEFTGNTTAKLALKNEGSEKVTITAITIEYNDGTGYASASFNFVTFTINTGAGQVKTYTLTGTPDAATITKWRVTVEFEIDGEAQTDLIVEFNP